MDDTGIAELIRKVLDIPEKEPVTLWAFPGIRDCPLAFHQEQGLANCPMGFDHRKVPQGAEPWMKGKCQDESWKDRWEQILAKCQQCQGKPGPSEDESSRIGEIQKVLFKRRQTDV